MTDPKNGENAVQLPDLATNFAGVAIFGTVITFLVRGWGTIRDFGFKCFRMVVVGVDLENEQISQALVNYMVANLPRSKINLKQFGGKYEHFKNGRFGLVPYEIFGTSTMMFWYGWWPVWIGKASDTAASSGKKFTYRHQDNYAQKGLTVSFLRMTVDIEDLIKKAAELRNQLYDDKVNSKRKRFFVRRIPERSEAGNRGYTAGTEIAWYQEQSYRLLSNEVSDLGRPSMNKNGRALQNLYFPAEVKDLIREVEQWRHKREWYECRGIPWKRGWLLYGPPGTGKTACARAIAEDTDMPLFSFSLGTMSNEDLQQSYNEMQAHVPCIALFEDIDNVFNGRENIYGKPQMAELLAGLKDHPPEAGGEGPPPMTGRLSFDCLLNVLDGVDKSGGVFVIITTNHPEKIDAALGGPVLDKEGKIERFSTRPGRVDRAIELTYMRSCDKRFMADRIFFDNEEGRKMMYNYIEENPNELETPAQFQERCAHLALQLLWKSENPEEVKEAEAVEEALVAPVNRIFSTNGHHEKTAV